VPAASSKPIARYYHGTDGSGLLRSRCERREGQADAQFADTDVEASERPATDAVADERLDGEGPDAGRVRGRDVVRLVSHFGSAYGRIAVLVSAVRQPTGAMSVRGYTTNSAPTWPPKSRGRGLARVYLAFVFPAVGLVGSAAGNRSPKVMAKALITGFRPLHVGKGRANRLTAASQTPGVVSAAIPRQLSRGPPLQRHSYRIREFARRVESVPTRESAREDCRRTQGLWSA
jgi:hypothetical protein